MQNIQLFLKLVSPLDWLSFSCCSSLTKDQNWFQTLSVDGIQTKKTVSKIQQHELLVIFYTENMMRVQQQHISHSVLNSSPICDCVKTKPVTCDKSSWQLVFNLNKKHSFLFINNSLPLRTGLWPNTDDLCTVMCTYYFSHQFLIASSMSEIKSVYFNLWLRNSMVKLWL